MASLEYQIDNSIIITDDKGNQIIVPPGSQTVQDAAVQTFLGNPSPPLVADDPASQLAQLLVDKGLLTVKEVTDQTDIDVAAQAIP